MKKKPVTKEMVRKEMKPRKQGSSGRAKMVFGRPARGMVKGYVPF